MKQCPDKLQIENPHLQEEKNPNDVFAQVAHILKDAKTDQDAVHKALKRICDEFSFEYGLFYELDDADRFCLMHRSGMEKTPREVITVEELPGQDRDYWAKKEIAYMQKCDENCKEKARLLDLFQAECLSLTCATNDAGQLCGFVVLYARSHQTLLLETTQNDLQSLLWMVVTCVNAQIYQRRIAHAYKTMDKLLDSTGIDIYVNDLESHDILYVNESMAAPYGGKKAFSSKKCWQVLFPGQTGPCGFCPKHKLIDEQGRPSKVYSWDYQRPFDGSWFRVFSAAFRWDGGRMAHIVSSANITENKKNEAIIENMANYDQLTQLPNRRMLLKECERRIGSAATTEQWYLLFFDIDGFKTINDTMGHDAGDEFLIKLGEFFSGIPLLKNAIYRNGGDEFVALLGGESISKQNIVSLAHFIHERFKKPWCLQNGEVFCNTSIGVACYPEDGMTADVLLQKADRAMYQVKKSGGAGICFGYQLHDAY